MKYLFLFITCIPHIIYSQTDYGQLGNWYYHPDKFINFIENYDLDIAVINKNLEVDSVIQIENNAGNDTGIDVFWLHPTELTNPPFFPTVVPIEDQNTALIGAVILGQGALFAKYGRFYAPMYRQATPASFLGFGFSEESRAEALIETYSDVKAAFLHYLNNENNGNKIIIAGHSQGSFLLAMLLRDFFDDDPELREQLVTASLAGMGYVYSSYDEYAGGWWENIPLCTSSNECGCIHYWRSYKESLDIPDPNLNLPSYNPILVDSGLVYRTTNNVDDWFRQDSLYYGSMSRPLRYYIAPDASYNLAPNQNIIAFDSLYNARFKRESSLEVGLSLEYIEDANDLRPNDIDSTSASPIFSEGDLHVKDYHIYLWAILEQIDSKLENCSTISSVSDELPLDEIDFSVHPNPSRGTFTIRTKHPSTEFNQGAFTVINTLGQVVETFTMSSNEKVINIDDKGIYFIISKRGYTKIVVN
ncbi:hypothetical protein CEQ90_19845 [Lewinellaceae bacterium SD302]|nr:hypothetical protein CEQ90_19845 [Lewinellaceae bacterium SD302]